VFGRSEPGEEVTKEWFGAQLDTRTINWEKELNGSSPSKQETKQPKVINELGSK
jgi:hypothetical protein